MWPAYGQAAVQIGQSQIQAGPNQHAAAIASVAKVMTAYLVLRDHPLRPGQDGPTITLTDADVADTDRRRGQQESVVSVAAGEQLTERQALQALLLPSANNIAAVLARWDAGSADRFVARMNATARSLGMTHTRYTDPSGYDDATVSTAADQVRIVDRAMRLPVFASIVATPSATLPVAGTVHNTNTLLGHDGFVGVKTGSTAAAGGCFAFRAIRWIDGKRTTITGVVLGQPGTTGSRRVSRPPTPWSTASPVIGLCRIHRNPTPPRLAGSSAPNSRSAENRCRCNRHARGESMSHTLRPLAALANRAFAVSVASRRHCLTRKRRLVDLGAAVLDGLPVAEEFVVLVVAAVAASEFGVVGNELDPFDPFDLFEAELDLVAEPQRSAVSE